MPVSRGLAILDEDDKLLRSVDLPLPPGGGGLLLVHAWVVGDGVAYGMLHSDQPPQTAIATISEKGNHNLDLKSSS